MYIIPKEKIKKIEAEVKPEYLKNVNKMVEQGILDAVREVQNEKINPRLMKWCIKLGKDLKNPKSEIFYQKIIESAPASLMAIYNKFRKNYNYAVAMPGGKTSLLFEEDGWNQARGIPDLEMAKKFLEKCFPYNKFTNKNKPYGIQYDAYKFCKTMDINVCIYCNAQLTHTVIRKGEKKIRPQIDHFFPQSRFPMFALSFYNLIPSCPVCNTIKREDFYNLDEIYHPYVDACTDFRFRWCVNKLEVDYDSLKAKNMVKMFHTEDVYSMYEGVAGKIVEKVQGYDPAYIDDLMDLMNRHRSKSEKLDREMVIRRIYDYVPEEECFDTPLGELRHDILADSIEKAYGKVENVKK